MSIAVSMVAILQGLMAVALLAILQAVLQIWAPNFQLPFDVWWGMLLCAPGLMMAAAARRR